MRKLVKTSRDDFRVMGYAGSNSVLLAFDVVEDRKADLMGFAIEKKVGSGKWMWLFNSLTFAGRAHKFPQWGATPSNEAPLQKFRWGDYAIEAGKTCKYKVHLVYGPQLDMADMLEIELKTDDGKPKDHFVQFNRAVAASQAFGRQFADLDARLSLEKNLPIEEWPCEASGWLENGLLGSILEFIELATDEGWALDVAIYEYELRSIVEAINAAHNRKAVIRVLYHAKSGDLQSTLNETNLQSLPRSCKQGRVTHKIFHHKFMVLSKFDVEGKRFPQAVLCGSTNFTENGVYRQANVTHTSENKELAQQYAALFEIVWSHPDDVDFARKWITTNNPIQQGLPVFAGFSPRSYKTDLAEFERIILEAKRDLFFATAFRLPESLLEALLGKPNDPILRFGIQNTASRITGFHADRTAEFNTPALLKNGLEGWVKEGLRGQKGNLLVHTKVVITDFTSAAPTILSGSHNLSVPASNGNDENFLILSGDTDLADRYGLEILRFYEHYRFRYYAKLLELKQAQPLSGTDRWTRPYFENGNLKEVSRLRFSGK